MTLLRNTLSLRTILFAFVVCGLFSIFISTKANSWIPSKSLTRIEPTFLVKAMNKYGGLVLPQPAEEDLKVLGKVCKCQRCFLDVFQHEIEVKNFTVSYNGTEALHVGKLKIGWDSYRKPCLDIELEDVDINIEFTNLLLTKSNWNEELLSIGFPPMMYYSTAYSTETEATATATATESFVRIGSVNLLGAVKLKMHSRVLNQPVCPDILFDFESLKEVMDEINELASKPKSQRRGLTTVELYDIISRFINRKAKNVISATVKDIAKASIFPKDQYESVTVNKAKTIFSGVRDTVSSYADKAVYAKDQQVRDQVMNRLQKWGLSSDDIDIVRDVSKKVSDATLKGVKEVSVLGFDNTVEKQKQRMREGFQTISEEAIERVFGQKPQRTDDNVPKVVEVEESEEDESDIMYPDW